MPTLSDIQRGFARSILLGETDDIVAHVESDGIPAADRLGIYRNTARTVLTEALRLTFPAVDRLVGGAFFDMAAARFIRRHPPRRACLDDYGADFADFLASLEEAAELPYLPDVARFEWALGVAAQARDVPPLDLRALAGLGSELHGLLRFEPHPSATLLHLGFPADHIADAVLSGDETAMAAVDLRGGPVWLVVHRGPEGVAAERIALKSYRFLRRLFAGEELGALLTDDTPDAAETLGRQFALGRITGCTTSGSLPGKETMQ